MSRFFSAKYCRSLRLSHYRLILEWFCASLPLKVCNLTFNLTIREHLKLCFLSLSFALNFLCYMIVIWNKVDWVTETAIVVVIGRFKPFRICLFSNLVSSWASPFLLFFWFHFYRNILVQFVEVNVEIRVGALLFELLQRFIEALTIVCTLNYRIFNTNDPYGCAETFVIEAKFFSFRAIWIIDGPF